MIAVRSVRDACSAGTRPKITALATATPKLKTSARLSISNASLIGKSLGISIPSEQQHARVADAEPEHAAGDGNHQALGDELANEPSASGANGEAQRHLTRANGRAARQQAGDVAARHEQHADRQRRQHRDQHRVRRIFRDARLQLGLDEELLVLVRRGIRALEVGRDGRQLALGLRLRRARFEPPFQPEFLTSRASSDPARWSLITRGDIISGTKKSERTTAFMPVNDSGATPITVNGTPLIRTLRPRTPASDANSCSHIVRPSTTTASRPGT